MRATRPTFALSTAAAAPAAPAPATGMGRPPASVNLKLPPSCGAGKKENILSVVKNKRGLSKMEFYHTARKLREDMTNMLLRDFGVRDKVRKIKTDDNIEVTIIEEYPSWLINSFRESIMNLLRDLMKNITAGNSIFPINDDELRLRHQYQTMAIVNCEQLLQEIQYCADILPVKLEKFMPYAGNIEFEIQLLKGWRKSSSRINKKLNQKEDGKEK
jgi:hypothetical protein